MKKIFAFALLLAFVSITVFGQDTIVFRNGDEVQAKVVKVSDAEIEFLIWNNQSGPVYVKKVADVFMVKYNGGHKDVFNNVQVDSKTNKKESIYDSITEVTIRGRFIYGDNGIRMDDSFAKRILTADEYRTFKSAVGQESMGTSLTFSGIVVEAAGFIFIFVSNLKAIGIPLVVVGNVMSMVGIPLWAVGSGRLNWVENSVNSRLKGNSLSWSVAPYLMVNPDRSCSKGHCYGVGLTFNF